MLNAYGLDNIGYMSVAYQTTLDCPDGGEGKLVSDSGGTVAGGGVDCRSITYRINSRYYYLKDHLGTIKMTVDSGGTVTSYDDYYPFGMTMEGRSGNFGQADVRYRYTGKERDIESGYDYFGARYYDSRVGRWLSMDPLSHRFPGFSPYEFSISNPVNYFDPDGRSTRKQRDAFYAGVGSSIRQVAITVGVSATKANYVAAHAALETEFGTKVKGNSYFGIKGESDYGSQTFATSEYDENEQASSLIDKFRAYENEIDATLDYFSLLQSSYPDAYCELMENSGGIEEFGNGLFSGTRNYATDPRYRLKLLNVYQRIQKEIDQNKRKADEAKKKQDKEKQKEKEKEKKKEEKRPER